MKPLSDGDRVEIKKTILNRILGNTQINFRSTSVTLFGGSNTTVRGDLTIAGKTAPGELHLTDLMRPASDCRAQQVP